MVNFARYKEKMKAYKAGLPVPEISDVEAKLLYEASKDSANNALSPPADTVADVTGETGSDSSTVSSSSEDESPAPVLKEPSPVPTKKQKASKDASKKKALAAEPEPILDPLLRATEKKKSSKKAKTSAPAVEAVRPEPPAVSMPKASEKQKKKKRKNAASE